MSWNLNSSHKCSHLHRSLAQRLFLACEEFCTVRHRILVFFLNGRASARTSGQTPRSDVAPEPPLSRATGKTAHSPMPTHTRGHLSPLHFHVPACTHTTAAPACVHATPVAATSDTAPPPAWTHTTTTPVGGVVTSPHARNTKWRGDPRSSSNTQLQHVLPVI
jgi:hypothetical protein